jgi:hypothetical protein
LRRAIIILLLLLIVSCNMAAGTPYENADTCMKDRHCSQQFTEYLDCKARYETGC